MPTRHFCFLNCFLEKVQRLCGVFYKVGSSSRSLILNVDKKTLVGREECVMGVLVRFLFRPATDVW